MTDFERSKELGKWVHAAEESMATHPVWSQLKQMEKDGKSGEEMYQVFQQALKNGALKDNLRGLITETNSR